MKKTSPTPLTIDYRSGNMPAWVRELINVQFALEQEDAKQAGALGFMARALVIATMPYKDPKADSFVRTNGDFRLRIVAGYEGGIPYGIYPRLLMSWVATEAVRTQSPVIELGDSLRLFMRDVLDLRSTGGGVRGSGTRVSEQMKRLFGSLVTAHYGGKLAPRGFVLQNVLIADRMQLTDADSARLDAVSTTVDDSPERTTQVRKAAAKPVAKPTEETMLWTPQADSEAGQWSSTVRLSSSFFTECVTNPVPIDLRAYKALRGSPLAMDVYTWLTYRMSYITRPTPPMRWESLMMQFGSGFNSVSLEQDVRNFRKAFLKALQTVRLVYPQAKFETADEGLVLYPSRPHVLPKQAQLPLL